MSRRRGRAAGVACGTRGARVLAAAPWLLALILASSTGPAAEPASLSVKLEGGRLSLAAETVPLGDVLSAIAEKSGIAVHLAHGVGAEAMGRPITLRLENLAVEQALARVLEPAHYVFLYSAIGLVEVRVYAWPPSGARPPAARQTATGQAGDSATETGDHEDGGKRAEAARWSRESVTAPDPDARARALEQLSEVDDRALITRTALDVLQRDQHAGVLEAALDLLADQESVPVEPLLHFAATTPDRGLRVRALEILAEQRPDDPRVAGLVQTLASRDPDPDFRATAAELLRSVQPR